MARTSSAFVVLCGFVTGCGIPSSTQTGPAPMQAGEDRVEPALENRDEVMRLMMKSLPADLKGPWSEASATIRVDVDDTGAVTGADVERQSAYSGFDEMALEMARHMRFTPARRKGRAIRASLSLPLS